MKITITLSVILILGYTIGQQWTITEVGQLPEAITNNPVCEGWQGDTMYIYTFGGIDNTLHKNGIHLRSFRFNTITGAVETLPDMPDSLGKLGTAANRIGDIIYVVGGYHVLEGGDEITSNKVHRFNTQTNSWMSDAAGLTFATDDHVQSVWRDSLLYVITGWKNTANIQHCQIYDPSTNQWLTGTAVPNNHSFKSFGASGTFVGDTLYYFGGTSSWTFNTQNHLRMGVINPNDPTDITWSFSTPNTSITGYRMAATSVNGEAHWIGGSSLSYNYDGVDYNGSGIVAPPNRDLFIQVGANYWYLETYDTIPMDLRGIGNVTDSIKYIMGGMFDNQVVSNKIYKLEYIGSPILGTSQELSEFRIFPNPTKDLFFIKGVKSDFNIELLDNKGKILINSRNQTKVDLNSFKKGVYFLRIMKNQSIQTIKIIKQ